MSLIIQQYAFSFRKTDENLYRGLPANQSGANKPSRNTNLFGDEKKKDNPLFTTDKKDSLFTDNDDLDFGGYQPSSFGASNKQLGSKAKLTAEDGNTWKAKDGGASTKTNTIDDLFGGGGTSTKKSLFDDDDLFSSSQKPKASGHEKKTNFPWDNDVSPATANKILPHRPRADHSTIHNKPTVRAIGNFDDDLEEVIL